MVGFLYKVGKKWISLFDKQKKYYLFLFVKDGTAYYWFINTENYKDIILSYAFWKGKIYSELEGKLLFFDVWDVFLHNKILLWIQKEEFFVRKGQGSVEPIANLEIWMEPDSFFKLFQN